MCIVILYHITFAQRPDLTIITCYFIYPVFFLQTYQVHGPYVRERRFEDPARPYRGKLEHVSPTHDDLERGTFVLDEADWRWLNDTYDAGIRCMDEVVGPFLEALSDAFGEDPYLVILTSDHGEQIGEHGDIGHAHDLHRELLYVPLVIRFPGGPAGAREARPVSSLDIVPTILDLAGLDLPPHLSGRSLRGDLPGRRLRVAEHGGTAFATDLDGWRLLSGSLTHSSVKDPFPRLLHSGEDPRESFDRTREAGDRARELEDELRRYLERYPRLQIERSSAAVDVALAEQLGELGYAGDE